MYDDHRYCSTCGKHAVSCYCFTYQEPEPGEDVCLLAARVGGLGHEEGSE